MINGQRLVADQVDAIGIMLDVAGGGKSEAELAVWVEAPLIAR